MNIKEFNDEQDLVKISAGSKFDYDKEYEDHNFDELEFRNPDLAAKCRQLSPKIFSKKNFKKTKKLSRHLNFDT